MTTRRKKTRLVGMLVILPAILLTSFVGIKVASMNYFASNTTSSFGVGEYTNSQQNADRQKVLNIFEPWLAYYNSGTSLLALGAFQESVTDLERALSLTEDPLVRCNIQANLAVALEQAGEEFFTDDQFDVGQEYFDRAQGVIDSTDERCLDEEQSPDSAESLSNTQERLDGKGEGDNEKPEQPEPNQNAQERLQDQIDQNKEDQQQEEDLRRSGSGGLPDSEPVDKPW